MWPFLWLFFRWSLRMFQRFLLGIRAAPTEDAQVDPDTGAASAVPPIITPVIRGDGRARIVTPYRADAFEHRLRALDLLGKYPELPSHIRGGFPMGRFSPLERSHVSDNRAMQPEHLTFIAQYVAQQVALGRMEGPYDEEAVKSILGSDFSTSPLFVVDKPGSPGQFRLVQDYSYKNEDGFAVNDAVDPEDYSTQWNNAHSVAQLVAIAKEGTQAAKLDIDSAFRNIPILPEHKPHFVIGLRPGEFYIDHVCPFGVRSGNGVHAEIMHAIIDILTASNPQLTIRVWVDDVVVFRQPSGNTFIGGWTYDHNIEDIFAETKDLGVPWKRGKCFHYADRVVYFGFLWDLRNRTVSVPDGKREQHLEKLNTFCTYAETSRVSLKHSKTILGALTHLAFVYANGNARLLKLSAFVATFPDGETRQHLPLPVGKDLEWWQTTLKSPFYRPLKPRSTERDPGVAAYASTSWGIGLMIGEKWAAWQLVGDWKCEGKDIQWLGTVAVELLCLCLEHLGVVDAKIMVQTDEEGPGRYFRRGRSSNPHTNLSARRIRIICTTCNIELSPEYVNGEGNIARQISRGFRGHDEMRLSARLEMPEELRPFLRRG